MSLAEAHRHDQYDTFLTEGEAHDLGRIADATVDVEDIDTIALMEGQRHALIPLAYSFDDTAIRDTPFSDELRRMKQSDIRGEPPYRRSPHDVEVIMMAMGDAYVVDPSRAPEAPAHEATVHLDMDYVAGMLQDGRPHELVYASPSEYLSGGETAGVQRR